MEHLERNQCLNVPYCHSLMDGPYLWSPLILLTPLLFSSATMRLTFLDILMKCLDNNWIWLNCHEKDRHSWCPEDESHWRDPLTSSGATGRSKFSVILWNISMSVRRICTKLCTEICGPEKMKSNDFGDVCLDNYWMYCHEIWYKQTFVIPWLFI